ncbi:MAG TPA: efflux RND transporter periplasmic adaptor subunit [Myxococcota bacterium]|nr:efflux RND transporter periplasmic adaptor subunit [Myxococcota bacterium]
MLLVLLACGQPETEAASVQAVPVEVVTVGLSPFSEPIEANGVLRADNQVTVLSEASGRVSGLPVAVGEEVQRGAPLVRLESGRQAIGVQAAEATLAKAEAVQAQARAQLDRAMALEGDLSQAQLDDARLASQVAAADVLAAEANLASARRQLADMSVRAPFAGTLTRRIVDLGQVISAGTPVANLADTSALQVDIGLPWALARSLSVGDSAEIHTDAGVLSGHVGTIAPELDRATGAVPVEILVEPGDALPNASATVLLETGSREALVLPRDATSERFGQASVFVVSDGVASLRAVELGATSGDEVEVTDGLSAGEIVVTVGGDSLREGSPVLVVD